MLFHFTDIDECLLDTDSCDKINADCTDSDGSYACTCHVGFTGNGETCCMYSTYHTMITVLLSVMLCEVLAFPSCSMY